VGNPIAAGGGQIEFFQALVPSDTEFRERFLFLEGNTSARTLSANADHIPAHHSRKPMSVHQTVLLHNKLKNST